MNNNLSNKGKPIWTFPWNYKEGFVFAIGFLVIGILMELANPLHRFAPPHTPYNIICLAFIIVAITTASIFWQKSQIVSWLSSIKSSLAAILLFSLLVLLIAIIPQKRTIYPVGLHIITHTWYFAIATLFLTITLGFAIAKRVYPFTGSNISFTISHLGLWLCIVAGLLGYGDKQEVKMQVNIDQLVWYGDSEKEKNIELPIAIKLEKFIAEYYSPKPALIVQGNDQPILSQNHPDISKDSIFSIHGIFVKVLHYYQRAYISDSGFIDARGVPYTGPAAMVEVTQPNHKNIKGWIAPECASFAERYLTLNSDTILRLLPAEPKYYASDVSIYSKSGITNQKHRIEVNSPLNIDGWYIYQYGYDNRAGRDSNYSIFLAVYDPWLWIVYAGMLMMLFGTILMSLNYYNKNQH
ncbi:MAG: cytochrome c biogenesis protein ResB [Bacteroidales bacterium]